MLKAHVSRILFKTLLRCLIKPSSKITRSPLRKVRFESTKALLRVGAHKKLLNGTILDVDIFFSLEFEKVRHIMALHFKKETPCEASTILSTKFLKNFAVQLQ